MEIIAKKNSGLAAVYFLGVLASVLGAVVSLSKIVWFIAFLFTFVVCVVEVIVLIIPPYNIITYEGDVLRFADGLQCTPSELEQVHYRRHSTKGLQYRTGTLTVTVNGQSHKYRNIANVVEVQGRLIKLMRSTKK